MSKIAHIQRLSAGGRFRLAGGGFLGALCLLGAQCPPVHAAGPPAPKFALQVSPTRLVIPTDAMSAPQRVQVTNKGGEPFTVTVEKSDFTASETGALNFLPEAPYAAAAWAEVNPRQFRLEPGKSRYVTIQMNPPADPEPEPGDHQLALIFKVPAGRNASNIKINRGIAAPVFLAVPGRIDSSVEVAGLRAPGFVTRGPVSLVTRIRDTGTVHRDFRGPGRLHAQAGGSDLTFPDFTVLRGSTREVATRWNPPLMCVCHATVSVGGTGEGTRTATVRIIVLPLHLLAIALGSLLALLLGVWFTKRRFRARVLETAAALNDPRDGSDL